MLYTRDQTSSCYTSPHWASLYTWVTCCNNWEVWLFLVKTCEREATGTAKNIQKWQWTQSAQGLQPTFLEQCINYIWRLLRMKKKKEELLIFPCSHTELFIERIHRLSKGKIPLLGSVLTIYTGLDKIISVRWSYPSLFYAYQKGSFVGWTVPILIHDHTCDKYHWLSMW